MSVLDPLAILHIMSAKRKMRSSTFSPEEKRARDNPEEADESTDAVLDALSMVEDMGDKLYRILKRLEKLDIIERRLDNVYTTMASKEESISKLNRDVKKTGKTDKKVDELEDSIAFNEDDISDLKNNAKATELELEKWIKEVLYLEAYSRRENVKFLASRRTRRAVRVT